MARRGAFNKAPCRLPGFVRHHDGADAQVEVLLIQQSHPQGHKERLPGLGILGWDHFEDALHLSRREIDIRQHAPSDVILNRGLVIGGPVSPQDLEEGIVLMLHCRRQWLEHNVHVL